MKIKQLELKGFKSFRNRTRIRFEEGISCIVGPNGCGKSNVVDAFLWVMGESAPKHLRGRAMEDLLFAGAGSYPPLSSAEVSLVMELPSSKKSLKTNKEIMITRRLDRDGLSEYFINSRPARLQDVRDIFMDTGVGVHGFSFIEQGAIEDFISSRPEHKKRMVESTAGIARFRTRKKSAERKLELTQHNLSRLTDLISRQAKELKKLKKQSETAKKFKEIKNHIRKTKWEIQKWDLLQIQKNEVTISKELEKQKQKQQQIQNSQQKLISLSKTLSEKQNLIREKSQKALKQKEILKAQMLVSEKEIAQKEVSLTLSRKNLLNTEAKTAEKKSLSSTLTECEKHLAQEEEKPIALKERENLIKKEEENLNQAWSSLFAKREQALALLNDKEKELALLKEKESRWDEKIKEEREKSGKTQLRLNQIEEELKKFLLKEKHLSIEREKSRQMSFDMSHLIDQEKEELNLLKKNQETQENQLKELREEEAFCYSEWQSLKKRKAFREEEDKAKNFILNSLDEGFLDIARSIKLSDPFLEKAVSFYLEPRLKALFSTQGDKVLKALNTLSQKRIGSCRFVLPLKTSYVREEEQSSLRREEGFLFFLKDKVEGDKVLTEALFSKVAVVKDREAAHQLNEKYPAWDFIALTGEVITKDGDLIFLLEEKESGVLSWQSAFKLAPINFEKAKAKRVSAEEVLEKSRIKFQKINQNISQLNQEEHSFEIRTMEIEKDIEVLNREKNTWEAENSLILKNKEEGIKKIKTWEEELLVLKAKILSLKSILGQMKKAEEGLKQALKQKEEEKQTVLESKEKLSQEKLIVEKSLSRLREQKKFLIAEGDRVFKEEKEKALKLKEDSLRISADEKSLNQKKEAKVKLEQAIDESQRNIQGLELKEKELIDQAEKAREDLIGFHQKVADQESEVNKIKLKKESLDLQKTALLESSAEEQDKEQEQDYILPEDFDKDKALETLAKMREHLSRMGEVNFLALKEYEELSTENNFYQKQYEDLSLSQEKLLQVIKKIDRFCSQKFKSTLDEVRGRFSKLWPALFEGGKADLILTEDQEGLDIMVQPPGKKIQNMNLLSGGEKAMTAVAMMFSLFLVKPSPFCILDEVDAPLDDRNVVRFRALLSEMALRSQMIVITHNKQTMQSASSLYGVTMEEQGISKIMSLKIPQTEFKKTLYRKEQTT